MAKHATGIYNNSMDLERGVWTRFINTKSTQQEIAKEVQCSVPTVRRILAKDPRQLREGKVVSLTAVRAAKGAVKNVGNGAGSRTAPKPAGDKSNMSQRGNKAGGSTSRGNKDIS